jgi:hypothetical protein
LLLFCHSLWVSWQEICCASGALYQVIIIKHFSEFFVACLNLLSIFRGN